MIGAVGAATPRRSLSRFLLWATGEIFVVVAGVLIAFGLNAWWIDRSARLEEQMHLRALERDFERNVSIYTTLLEREEEIVTASRELLQLARKQPGAEAAIVSPLMGHVFQSLRMEPALDAYQALVNSAGLTLLRDEELRGDLAGFASRGVDPYFARYSDQLYMAFTTRFVGRLQIAGIADDEPSPGQSYADLLGDSAFQEHLALRHFVERDVAGEYRQLLHQAEDILARLRTQIE